MFERLNSFDVLLLCALATTFRVDVEGLIQFKSRTPFLPSASRRRYKWTLKVSGRSRIECKNAEQGIVAQMHLASLLSMLRVKSEEMEMKRNA
jgi:hypothetical protein